MVKTDAFAKTKAGTLQGVCIDGIYRFLGVHYAESTAGENRFQPPQPLIPWEGVKPALEYAGKCWQTDHPSMEATDNRATKYPWLYEKLCTGTNEMGSGFQSEDCLALNIWSQGLRDGKKRPVMVWFHGGGNFAGAAEANWHDGYNLAKKQDVVLVSIGHRLGVFGYLYLGEINEKYKNTANLGHQDMVAALKWINENIEEFGGDPENVTIFGQSGGGQKVATLMAMPSAKGLVHKAIIQSGGYEAQPVSAGTAMAQQLLDYLKLDKDSVDELLKIPPEEIIRIVREMNATRNLSNFFICPVILDGEVIKYDPFDGAEGSEYSKDVGLMTGYTKDDSIMWALFTPAMFSYTYEELPEKIMARGYTAEEADKLIDAYKRLLGDECTASLIFTSLLNDEGQLVSNLERYQSRAKVGAKPMYNFVFCHEGPDKELKAVHGVDVPFVFDNGCYAPGMWDCDTYHGAMKLSNAAGAAWAAFARTGNPSNPYMPVWKPYEEGTRYSMLVNVESELVSDYRREVLDIILAAKK